MFGQAQSTQPTSTTPNFGLTPAPAPTTGFAANILGSSGQQQQPASKPFFAPPSSGTNLFGAPASSAAPAAATAATSNQPFSFGFGFGQPQQQQQPALNTNTTQLPQAQAQSQPLLSLQSVFPDTNVPHFIVTPDKVTRTSMPKLLSNANTKTRDRVEEYPATASLSFGAKRTVLPRFLTAVTLSSSNRHASGKKRAFESEDESRSGHQPVYKRSHSNGSDSIFGTSATGSFCNSNTPTVTSESDDPPALSIWNVGINTHRYSANEQLVIDKSKPTANPIVRVFGFPPDQTPAVVEYFSRFGPIAERYHQSSANWMTLRYATNQMAERALESHGKIIGKEIRVGVDRVKSMTG
ncbi:hypothetical protein BX666DRAFT_1879529 [Dichotomocladium elegans]|nr:hypothetical protein BX666DRAFT_1879529 [Dichotomocladium elegans]